MAAYPLWPAESFEQRLSVVPVLGVEASKLPIHDTADPPAACSIREVIEFDEDIAWVEVCVRKYYIVIFPTLIIIVAEDAAEAILICERPSRTAHPRRGYSVSGLRVYFQ